MIVAFWDALKGFRHDNGLFLAAGVSFYFLVCLVPMLFLFVSVMGYILTSEAATSAVLSQLSQIVPVYKKELAETLMGLIATRKTSGVIGTVVLLFFSTQLFACLRMVMNVIFEGKITKRFRVSMSRMNASHVYSLRDCLSSSVTPRSWSSSVCCNCMAGWPRQARRMAIDDAIGA